MCRHDRTSVQMGCFFRCFARCRFCHAPSAYQISWSAIAGAATFGVANVLFGWALKFIANVILFLPKLLTLGLLGFVVPVLVNMVLLKLAANATDGEIEIQGISGLAGLSVIVTLTSVVAF